MFHTCGTRAKVLELQRRRGLRKPVLKIGVRSSSPSRADGVRWRTRLPHSRCLGLWPAALRGSDIGKLHSQGRLSFPVCKMDSCGEQMRFWNASRDADLMGRCYSY